ncbi:MAG: C4-type zinc ribbon domain-containing protein [Prosthecobacter sp.]|nr:C4-type zinc ribbon domain-containing protein [Prosthecobacter sp.]
MLPEITKLLKLQERDQRIRQLQKELKDIPKHEAQARAQLAGDLAAVESTTLKAKEVEVKIKGFELDIQTRQNSIKRLHDQQFETRKNDEFQALGTEIVRYEKDVRGIEDKELEAMEELEGAKAAQKEAQARLKVTQSRVNDELKTLAERVEGVRKRLADLEAERAELAAPVEPEALDLYQRLFNKKPDAAVVPLEGGICKGCHMKVVMGTIQDLRAGEAITQCESCGRILYLVE